MRHFVEIARTGLTAILLHPLRSAVTVTAVVAVLLPYLVGLGISRGVQEQAEAAVRFVGRIELGAERISAVLVGVPLRRFPPELACVEGRLYQSGNRNEL